LKAWATLCATDGDATAKDGQGNFKISAYAERVADRARGDKAEKFTTSLEPLPTLPTQLWSEPAQCVLHAFDVLVPANLRVGTLRRRANRCRSAAAPGIRVEMLNAAALAFQDLSPFNAIVIGVRAYELRPELSGANQRLLDYVSKGGTLVVQYQRSSPGTNSTMHHIGPDLAAAARPQKRVPGR